MRIRTLNLFAMSLIRDKLAIVIPILILSISIISLFLGYVSMVEQLEGGITFAASISRVLMVMGSILFISNHVSKLYHYKEIYIILTKNISRNRFVFEYLINILILCFMISLINFACINLFFSTASMYNMLIWSLGQFLELCIISFFAFIITLITNNTVISSIISITLYFIARINGFVLMISLNSWFANSYAKMIMFKIYNFCSIFIPRLDIFASTSLLVPSGQNSHNILNMVMVALSYIFLILLVGLYDFNKKEL